LSLEIEKKYIVGNFDGTITRLKNQFGKYVINEKLGFWWCNNHDGIENILDIENTKILKKEIINIKDIGEFNMPVENFEYIRLRIFDKKKYVVTFKNKSLVNNIEHNVEYEFETDFDTFKRITYYLKDTALIFYYNVKKTWLFSAFGCKIELSTFNDLKDSYIEVETTGENEKKLSEKLNSFLEKMDKYNLIEEPRKYVELSRIENKENLKRIKISKYSRDAYNILSKYL
jgi:hypothetical protein